MKFLNRYEVGILGGFILTVFVYACWPILLLLAFIASPHLFFGLMWIIVSLPTTILAFCHIGPVGELGQYQVKAHLVRPLHNHQSHFLPDETLLFYGGTTCKSANDCPPANVNNSFQLYDPKLHTVSNLPFTVKLTGRGLSNGAHYESVTLNNGNILFYAPYRNSTVATINPDKVYEWKTRRLVTSPHLFPQMRSMHPVALEDGTLLIAGGATGNGDDHRQYDTLQFYDPATGSIRLSKTKLPHPDYDVQTIRLNNGNILLIHDHFSHNIHDDTKNQSATQLLELYDPKTDQLRHIGALPSPRHGARFVELKNGRILIAGGFYRNRGGRLSYTTECQLLDLKTGQFKPTGAMNWLTVIQQSERLPDGRVLLIGSDKSSQGMQKENLELYDPAAGRFKRVNRRFGLLRNSTMTVLPNGKILLSGGERPVFLNWKNEPTDEIFELSL